MHRARNKPRRPNTTDPSLLYCRKIKERPYPGTLTTPVPEARQVGDRQTESTQPRYYKQHTSHLQQPFPLTGESVQRTVAVAVDVPHVDAVSDNP